MSYLHAALWSRYNILDTIHTWKETYTHIQYQKLQMIWYFAALSHQAWYELYKTMRLLYHLAYQNFK